MAWIGLLISLLLFAHFRRRLRVYRRLRAEECTPICRTGAVSWHEQWHRQWAGKFERQAERRRRQLERNLREIERQARRFGFSGGRLHALREVLTAPEPVAGGTAGAAPSGPQLALPLPGYPAPPAPRRTAGYIAFHIHLLCYLGSMAFLAVINLVTTPYPWFLWPAIGWGFGLFIHYMAVFGSRMMRERYLAPRVEREVRREKEVMHTEKQATIDELSATIAHEIRNPIAAAKSLVQQIGEDPTAAENVEYASVAIEELDRVERRISHLLKYAKEEDYSFAPVALPDVVDSALGQLRAKLDSAQVTVQRHYAATPTLVADGEKLRQVFANIVDNATDALEAVPLDQTAQRRLEVSIENGTPAGVRRVATVRLRDNGIGIPADKIDRIFNPFFTTKDNGTGLGMAISKKIVEAHEGTINVISEAGHGSEFVVTLPLPPE